MHAQRVVICCHLLVNGDLGGCVGAGRGRTVESGWLKPPPPPVLPRVRPQEAIAIVGHVARWSTLPPPCPRVPAGGDHHRGGRGALPRHAGQRGAGLAGSHGPLPARGSEHMHLRQVGAHTRASQLWQARCGLDSNLAHDAWCRSRPTPPSSFEVFAHHPPTHAVTHAPCLPARCAGTGTAVRTSGWWTVSRSPAT